jgi:hypothetical protein
MTARKELNAQLDDIQGAIKDKRNYSQDELFQTCTFQLEATKCQYTKSLPITERV